MTNEQFKRAAKIKAEMEGLNATRNNVLNKFKKICDTDNATPEAEKSEESKVIKQLEKEILTVIQEYFQPKIQELNKQFEEL